MEDISKIVRAKLSDKSDMPSWYKSRLDICKGCPLYSGNVNIQTIPEKLRYASLNTANLGKPFCWKCGCDVEAKASLPESECPGKPQRWKSILGGKTIIDNIASLDFSIENLSPDKVVMEYKRGEFELQYGDIEEFENTTVYVVLEPKTENDFINLRVTSDCGCTEPTIIRDGRKLKLKIEYDSRRLDEFSKLITLRYTSNVAREMRIRIKGVVHKKL